MFSLPLTPAAPHLELRLGCCFFFFVIARFVELFIASNFTGAVCHLAGEAVADAVHKLFLLETIKHQKCEMKTFENKIKGFLVRNVLAFICRLSSNILFGLLVRLQTAGQASWWRLPWQHGWFYPIRTRRKGFKRNGINVQIAECWYQLIRLSASCCVCICSMTV